MDKFDYILTEDLLRGIKHNGFSKTIIIQQKVTHTFFKIRF